MYVFKILKNDCSIFFFLVVCLFGKNLSIIYRGCKFIFKHFKCCKFYISLSELSLNTRDSHFTHSCRCYLFSVNS